MSQVFDHITRSFWMALSWGLCFRRMAGDDIGLCMEVIMLGKWWLEGSKWGATSRSMWKQGKVTTEKLCVWPIRVGFKEKPRVEGVTIIYYVYTYGLYKLYASLSFLLLFLTNRILDFELKYFIIISLHMRMCLIHIPTVTASSTRPAAWASQLTSSSSYSPIQTIVAPSWLSLHTNFT